MGRWVGGTFSDSHNRVRGDLIEVFKFRLDIRKYVFGNMVTDKWNNLLQCCTHRGSVVLGGVCRSTTAALRIHRLGPT